MLNPASDIYPGHNEYCAIRGLSLECDCAQRENELRCLRTIALAAEEYIELAGRQDRGMPAGRVYAGNAVIDIRPGVSVPNDIDLGDAYVTSVDSIRDTDQGYPSSAWAHHANLTLPGGSQISILVTEATYRVLLDAFQDKKPMPRYRITAVSLLDI